MIQTKRKPVTKANPCPVCCGNHKCSTAADGSTFCGRTFTDSPGFKFMGKTACETWGMFRAADDPTLGRRGEPRGPAVDLSGLDAKCSANKWPSTFAQHEAALTSDRRVELANALGLPDWSIVGVGWAGDCWTFPERDAGGRIIGINRRYRDGSKRVMPGGNRGLTILDDWDRGGPVFLVEGASDVLAMRAMGLSVIGRPSNTGGVELLVELLRGLPDDRQIVVVGENDRKPDEKWPGREGAMTTASRLTAALSRPVAWAMPADGSKDVRAWATANALDDQLVGTWQKLGDTFAAGLTVEAVTTAESSDDSGIVLTCLGDVRAEPVKWLWPSRIALGKLTTFAGDPGLGKSFITLDLAARVSTGAAWPDGSGHAPRGSVILMAVEDDLADTIRPRLDAAGADVRKIHALEGVEVRAKGKEPFQRAITLEDIATVRRAVERLDDCKLVVIDPISCFLGESDSHKNAEVRALLAPLCKLAADKGIAVIIVSHLSKGSGAAMYRTMGSIAFVAAARAAFIACKDKDDASGKRRLFLPVKNNLGDDQTGMAYRFGADGDGRTRIEWEAEPVTISASDALAEPTAADGDRAEKRRERSEKKATTLLLTALDKLADSQGWATISKVRRAAGLSNDVAARAVFLLAGEGLLTEGTKTVEQPNGGERKCLAIRRVKPNEAGMMGQNSLSLS